MVYYTSPVGEERRDNVERKRFELGIDSYELKLLNESLDQGISRLGTLYIEVEGKVLVDKKKGEPIRLDDMPGVIDRVIEQIRTIKKEYNGAGIDFIKSLKNLRIELERCGKEKELVDLV